MKSKILSMLIMLILVVNVVLTGCGNNKGCEKSSNEVEDKTNQVQNNSDEKSTKQLPIFGDNLKYDPNVPINNGEPITIKFWFNEDWSKIYDKWTEEYTKIHPNVKFEISKSGWGDYWKKLPIALQSGTGPDIFHMHNGYTDIMVPNMESFPEDILPIDKLNADFRQVNSHLIDGKIYYIDVGLMTSVMFYNKEMWKDAGLTENDIPKTWDQLIEVSKKLTKKDDSGKILVNGFDFNGSGQFLFQTLISQSGNYKFKQDEKNTYFSNPEIIKCAEFLQDVINVHAVLNPKGAPAHESFGNQKSAIIYSWAWADNFIGSNFPNLEYGIFPVPTIDGNVPPAYDRNNGECTIGVSAKTNDKAKGVAFDFIKYYLANDEAMKDISLKIGIASSKYSLDNCKDFSKNPVVETQASIIDRTIWDGITASAYGENLEKIINDELFLQNKPAEEVLKKFDEAQKKIAENTTYTTCERAYKFADEFKDN